jgi:succinate dehydrogenase / fumarate reductase membrane anchor subunit
MATITRAEIARLRARGSARAGFGHWKLQRLTALANVALILWFVIAAVSLAGTDYVTARAWLATPFNGTMMALFVISVFWHAKLGLQVVIEDYVHHEGGKLAALVAINLVIVALAVACLVAIARVSSGS